MFILERVTDSGNLAIDWTIALEICDALGETDEGPREAIRAIRKRLTSSAGKDHISIWYTLILIEACLKNCGRRFQAQVANRDFLHDLIKVLLPKHNPPIQLQTKILFMIKVCLCITCPIDFSSLLYMNKGCSNFLPSMSLLSDINWSVYS
ncbi:unnamed protein product [Hymenolepis diminuta]|uniref:VHS domain-containing protein n=1 Tax=Hymenolepis diminuta TaxID=6216 RepID=A0A0R3SRR5_HYMDI|nr:unnamed protein product [Hymenolepis diminuta]